MSSETHAEPTESGAPSAEMQEQDPAQRHLSLDVLRGFAVLAALLVSVWAVGGFSTNMQAKLLTHPSGGNYRLFAAVSLLLEGKMQSLIALLFGAGLVMYLTVRQQKDKDTAHDLYVRRHMWLIGFGVVNAFVFLWWNDLLFHLGVMGILTLPFIPARNRSLLIGAVLALAIYTGKQYWNYADDKKALRKYEAVVAYEKKIKPDSAAKKTVVAKPDSANSKTALQAKDTAATAKAGMASKDSASAKKDTLTNKQVKEKEAWEGRLKGMKYDAKKDEGERKEMRNTSYGKVWNHLVGRSQAREAQWTYRTGVWALGMMVLLGMALMKMGFFHQRLSAGRYLITGVGLLAVGLLMGWYRIYFHNATLLDYTKYLKSHWLPYTILVPLEYSTMAVGYAALLSGMVHAGWLQWLWKAVAAVGRMSLTNYLLQCLAGTLIFTGVGMNYYGDLPQWQLYLVVLELWLVQIAFSMAWFHFFDIGPAEWLWQSLVEKKKQPWRKQA